MLPPPDPPVTISGRALALITTPAGLRRLRIAHRADPVYEDLVIITAVVLGGADTTRLAVQPPGRNAGDMTTQEFAERAGITPNAVRRACSEGRITASKRSGVWLIPAAELVKRQAAC